MGVSDSLEEGEMRIQWKRAARAVMEGQPPNIQQSRIRHLRKVLRSPRNDDSCPANHAKMWYDGKRGEIGRDCHPVCHFLFPECFTNDPEADFCPCDLLGIEAVIERIERLLELCS